MTETGRPSWESRPVLSSALAGMAPAVPLT